MREAATKCNVDIHLGWNTFLWRVFACHFSLYPFCVSRKANIAETPLTADRSICWTPTQMGVFRKVDETEKTLPACWQSEGHWVCLRSGFSTNTDVCKNCQKSSHSSSSPIHQLCGRPMMGYSCLQLSLRQNVPSGWATWPYKLLWMARTCFFIAMGTFNMCYYSYEQVSSAASFLRRVGVCQSAWKADGEPSSRNDSIATLLCFAKKVWRDCQNGLPRVELERFSFVEMCCHNGLPRVWFRKQSRAVRRWALLSQNVCLSCLLLCTHGKSLWQKCIFPHFCQNGLPLFSSLLTRTERLKPFIEEHILLRIALMIKNLCVRRTFQSIWQIFLAKHTCTWWQLRAY